MTVAEFLEWDDGTDVRYELLGGVPVAMAPTLLDHGVILNALGAELRSRLRPPCRALTEAGVRLPQRDDAFFVADLAVVCSDWARADRYLTDPVVLFEVLSPSTAAHDRGDKAAGYRMIGSVQDIVLVSTAAVTAEIWRRTERGWLIEDVTGADGVLHLPSISVDLPLAAVYRDIPLEQPAPGTVAGAG